MFTIDKDNKIEVIQGDTGILNLSLDNYSLQDGDKVYFTVKSGFDSERFIFKEITNFKQGRAKIILTAVDTNINVGAYLYDVQCNLADGRVDTVIRPTRFKVLGGITDA